MSFDALENLFGSAVEEAAPMTDAITSIERNMTIETSLFDITFKKFRHADNVFDPSMDTTGVSVISLAEKIVIQVASESVRLRASLCGDEAVVDKTAPMVNEMFEEGVLKDQYKANLTEAQIQQAERACTKLMALTKVVYELEDAYNKFFPHRREKLQFAWDKNTGKGITNPIDAVKYRVDTCSTMNDLRKAVTERKNGGKVLASKSYATAAQILGI